ncbi:MAG: archaeal heat shock protein Hsp14 [Cuniculiplasma sp.]
MTTVYGPLKFMADEFVRNANERAKEVLSYLYPPIRMYEENGEIVIEADMPGFEKKDIKVTTGKMSIEISASRKTPDNVNMLLDQRPDKIWKSVKLPVELENDGVFSAKYTAGVLVIRAPIKGLKTLKVE